MIIYEITNKINGKIYVGQHSGNSLGSYWGSGKLIKRAIEKYGLHNFEKKILEKCLTKDELNIREKYWIAERDSISNGYNMTEGGTGGNTSNFINYSEDWKRKQKEHVTKYWKSLSEEQRKERGDKVRGSKNGMYGKDGVWKDKKIPKEMIRKTLESRRSYEGAGNPNWKGGTLKKKCQCGKDIPINNQACNTCRDRRGSKNPFYGKTHSEETKVKLSEARKGKKPTNIKKISIDDIIYMGLSEASNKTGIKVTTIWYRIKSKNKKYDNYKYLD